MAVVKLTKSFIDDVDLSQDGKRLFYHDRSLPGFMLIVGKTRKTFAVQSSIRGRTVRYTIGRYGLYTLDEARKVGREKLIDLSNDIDPNAAKRDVNFDRVKLEQVLEGYVAAKNLKSRTVKDYQVLMSSYLKDWRARPITDINKQDILQRHRHIGEKHGHSVANKAMRLVRSLFYFAEMTYDLKLDNPVKYITHINGWYPEYRRQNYISPAQLPAWYKAVNSLKNINYRDLFLLVVFTGLRKSEALQIKWENIDFENRTFIIPDTKNGEALILPMSDFVHDLLKQRSGISEYSVYVFPGKGAGGYFKEPKKGVYKVREATGIDFTVHDLRRTFITIAEGLNLGGYAVKRLVNHKMSNDVTAGYIVKNVDRLREPVQDIANYILEVCDGREANKEQDKKST